MPSLLHRETSCEERITHLDTGGAAQYESISMTSRKRCSLPNVLREYNIHLEGSLNVASSGTHPLHETGLKGTLVSKRAMQRLILLSFDQNPTCIVKLRAEANE